MRTRRRASVPPRALWAPKEAAAFRCRPKKLVVRPTCSVLLVVTFCPVPSTAEEGVVPAFEDWVVFNGDAVRGWWLIRELEFFEDRGCTPASIATIFLTQFSILL